MLNSWGYKCCMSPAPSISVQYTNSASNILTMKSSVAFSCGLSLISLTSAQNTTTCATGVHMIVARASTEPAGEGIIGAVATMVKASVPGSDSEAVDYPATLTNYTTSEPSGVAAMTKLITDYTTRCPDSKIALLGYSQVCFIAPRIFRQLSC